MSVGLQGVDGENQGERKVAKNINVIKAISIIVCSVIGAGIFVTVGNTMHATAPSIGILLILWMIGGMIALTGGLCYADLGSRIPKSGGERTYLTEAFGEKISITFTVWYTLVIKGTTYAALASVCASYIVNIFMYNILGGDICVRILTIVIILFAFLLNCLSAKWVTNSLLFFTAIKIAALLMIIITGIVHMATNPVPEFKRAFYVENFKLNELGKAANNILWSFEGFSMIASLVGDMIHPKRDLPIAMGISMSLISSLYALTICAYVSVLGYNVVSKASAVGVLFGEEKYGKFSFIIPLLISVSALGSCTGGFLSVAKVGMVAGASGEIPKVFSLVRRNQRTPVVSLFVLMLATCIFSQTDFNSLVNYCAFATWVVYFSVMCALIKFKVTNQYPTNGINVFIILPIIIQLVSLFVIVMSFKANYIGATILVTFMIGSYAALWLPERILKPRILVKLHDKLCSFLSKHLCLDFAVESDIC